MPIALGADWAPSGCRNMLGELKVARAVSEQLGGLFTAQELVATVTAAPARMVGWHRSVGTLAPGLLADVLVLRGTAADPYTHIISAHESDVAAVLIDGRPRLASAELALGDPASCESLTIGGRTYLLDLTELNEDNLGGMRLSTATAKLAYGLAHLPDLASTFQPAMAALVEGPPQAYWLEDEFSNDSASSLEFNPMALPTKALRLDPITACDDPSFPQRMRASPNLPEYVKVVF
ncbi:MAG: amidohydrolase family protein [Hydrogenophilales bacterium]|nr:amidohydrolase family protein [Hydrogenophilales bacterium]